MRGQHLDEFDELLVAFGDVGVLLLPPVAVLHENLVTTVDVDVLDLWVVEERLQATDSEQGRVDGRGQSGLLLCRRRRATVGDLEAGVVLEDLDDQRARVFSLVLRRHRDRTVHLVAAALVVEPVSNLLAELAHQVVVDHCVPPGGGAVRPCRNASFPFSV